ncbi:MAG TPA: FHA domain-containing protein [Thermoanaerobaculia bacterium]|nr:FHA domain-containing protein [Thermoanaerobaculia bacterium]
MPEIPNPRVFLVRGGQVLAEMELPSEGELVVGRTPQCQLVVPDATVSRMHARIFSDGQGVYLEDLGSANGTFVDDERVKGVVRLSDGQTVRPGQKSVADPVLVRFEDPARRLLREMGLLSEEEPGQDAADRGEHEKDPAPTVPPPVPARQPTPAPAPLAEAASGDGEVEAADEEPAPPRRRWYQSPLIWAAAVLALVAFGSFLFWLSRVFAPASTSWSTVQLSSHEVGPGAEVVLQSPDIAPSEDLRVLFAGEPVAGAEARPGRLTVPIPTLPDRPAGSYPVPLAVKQGGLDVFAATLTYSIRPQVTGIEPESLRVGDTLVIAGSALPDSVHQVKVLVGTTEAPVLSATPERVEVRIPQVTRAELVALPVTVRAGGEEVRAPGTLRVGPKLPRPLDLDFQAIWRPGHRAWEVRSAVGPAFYLAAPPPAGDDLPPQVDAALNGLEGLFAMAAKDPDARVELAAGSGRYTLRAVTPSRERPLTVAQWTPQDLQATAAAWRLDVPPDMLAYWMAGVWNHYLEVFARGRAVPAPPQGPAYGAALNRLIELNREAGGGGRPEAPDLEQLEPAAARTIAQAFASPPPAFGRISGRWQARLSNVFFPDQQYAIELDLTLRQNGRALSGNATVALQGTGLTFRVPPTTASGRMEPGIPPQVTLEMGFNRPVGRLTLVGALEGGTLQGTFRSSLAKQQGEWQAVRVD